MVRQTDHVEQMGPHASIKALVDPPRFAGIGPGRTKTTERAVSSRGRMAHKVLIATTAVERL
jgi:hypothetical protein